MVDNERYLGTYGSNRWTWAYLKFLTGGDGVTAKMLLCLKYRTSLIIKNFLISISSRKLFAILAYSI